MRIIKWLIEAKLSGTRYKDEQDPRVEGYAYRFRSNEQAAEVALATIKEHLVPEIMEAQADLQVAIGLYRLEHGRGNVNSQHADLIESRLTASLARTHRLLAMADNPMYGPATHKDIEHTDYYPEYPTHLFDAATD